MGAGSQVAGVIAAATAPCACATGIFLWARGWRGSPFALNLFKCSLASIVFLVVALAASPSGGSVAAAEDEGGAFHGGQGLESVSPSKAGWLAFSGVLGIIVGDNAWLLSLQILGPRRVVFCDNLKPFLAAALGKWWLGEDVGAAELLIGILLTACGVTLVSLEKARRETHSANRNSRVAETWGWAAAAANVSLDTVGSALTKIHGQGLTTWQINLIRFGSAAVGLMAIAAVGVSAPAARRWWVGRPPRRRRPVAEPETGGEMAALGGASGGVGAKEAADEGEEEGGSPADVGVAVEAEEAAPAKEAGAWARLPKSMPGRDWAVVSVGVALTTFLCPALSNFALFLISLPAWATLGALGPMYALPLGWLLKGEPVTWRAVLGAALAVAGVVPVALHES